MSQSLLQARYDVAFFIGPCSEQEAETLADAILGLAAFRAVGGGGVALERLECACGTPTILCECGDTRCPKCDPSPTSDPAGCPGGQLP